ncbi:MAG: P-loop NTPase [Bacteroidales bacterium]|nr:P-loop NTPase [Bacteroidales bacterium]
MKIAVASGKGGTGKTFISTNLFHAVQGEHESICLLDCDSEEPNVLQFFKTETIDEQHVYQKVPVIDENKCTFCGKCREACVYNAIFIIPPSKIIKVLENLCHGCGACTVACKYDAITEKDDSLGIISKNITKDNANIIETRVHIGVYSSVRVIKESVKYVKDYETVIIDAPPGTSCPFIQSASASDYIILVTEPTPFGLSDLKQSIDTLKTMNKKYGVIINRIGLGNDDVYKYLEEENIPILMEIPYSKEIAEAYSNGKLYVEQDKEFEDNLKQMFNKILEDNGNSSN